MTETHGTLEGTGLRIALVVARFNELITDQLLDGAVESLVGHGVSPDDLRVVRVPGAWELPGACARVIEAGEVDAVVALGCVIRGATPHFDFIAGEATRSLGELNRRGPVPVGFGVLTTDTLEQALERAGTKAGNKGREAALATLEMATLYRELG